MSNSSPASDCCHFADQLCIRRWQTHRKDVLLELHVTIQLHQRDVVLEVARRVIRMNFLPLYQVLFVRQSLVLIFHVELAEANFKIGVWRRCNAVSWNYPTSFSSALLSQSFFEKKQRRRKKAHLLWRPICNQSAQWERLEKKKRKSYSTVAALLCLRFHLLDSKAPPQLSFLVRNPVLISAACQGCVPKADECPPTIRFERV